MVIRIAGPGCVEKAKFSFFTHLFYFFNAAKIQLFILKKFYYCYVFITLDYAVCLVLPFAPLPLRFWQISFVLLTGKGADATR